MGYPVVKIGLRVADLRGALDFYTGLLGMEVLERFPQPDGTENVFLDGGSVILELMPGRRDGEAVLHHIALGAGSTEETAARLEASGAVLEMRPVVVENTIHLADFRDPDGLRIRLFHRD